MPEATVSGDVTLHYEDTGGDGRPVVLIHGWPLSGRSWQAQVPALAAAGYRVVTYDRRGFGESDGPLTGYDYDQLSDDLANLVEHLDLQDTTLVGFSMGGGEVARYLSRQGSDRIRSVVFASAVPPYLLHGRDNPDGPLKKTEAAKMAASLTANRDAFFDSFITEFFSADGELKVTEEQRQEAIDMAQQANKNAALQTMTAFGATDFRDDLAAVTVPTLVIHGDSDATVPFEGSGKRTHEAIPGSRLVVIADGPHGVNVSHADEFNEALLDFLAT
ncbi:pimeloyl-ACP methyl ester carboxylesterase [Knoellia remsis]|uniref:Pimeloyl-ACP methyl ester carboxylesterase n=1 Tax=Knoellia remsis TaxID=407159 RepID=A0A2T0U6B2_9MICO|nr:alpha/beta hydrolase [Knoellia remsis]PRY53422.1 pimeloyl-ACP methyl ester carboxylesterase [Knoellia remsis]